ncbi:GDSL esterase/lipase [Zea mays]|uniref:GDSL esterase/lipase n=1 Tax=Zea mays TaxID=4577 RepID=A0A1D6FGQ0_MAIZE|nr:GDSL esterase/lipase [Zea mays]
MRAAELHLHVQLRRLAHRHRQPARVQPALQPHRRPLPLRHHLLPPLHRPLLRRPPRRRLPSASVRPAAADVLRRRRAVQLQPEGELRRAGVQRVRGPVGVRQLGRRAPDGGRLPRHRRQHPQRALHQPQAPLIRTPVVEARRPSIGSRSSYNCSGANNVAGL